ncbi:MAG: ABC transporter substrate-binding protein [Anaerolineae bacterium]|jgi:iron complex transport system substrate-binding protein
MKHPSPKQVIALYVLISLLLAACGSVPTEQVHNAAPTASIPHTSEITIVDAQGRTVVFPEPPQRIIVAGRSSLTIIDTLFLYPEAQDRVAGLVAGRQKPGDFLDFVDPTFDQKAVLEMEAGPEQIGPLNPDVVLLRTFMADSLGAPLEAVDIPVVYVDLETPEQYFRDVAVLGQLLDNPARAEEILAFYQSKLDNVENSLENLSDAHKPRVLVVQYSEQGGEMALNVPAASWLQTTEAELAGGRPVWKEAAQGGGWTVVNFEQVAAWDPDKIFVIYYQGDAAEIVDQLATNPQWQALRAVQNGEVYGFGGDIFSWDQPDPRWILGVTWLATKTHPDRFANLDMRQEASEFFQQMYGLDEATFQQHIAPQLKGDIE